ncbi:MAG: MaoC family dehydratase [Methylobacteriaceae bacterium]|nr:MaoC family dehydratase [Methylobacteriaceae bacterium]
MSERYYEDFTKGQILPLTKRTITKDEIIAYASVYDAQPFHTDEEAAKKLMLGGLAASGWHTACVIMRMNYDSWLKDTASLGAPGIDELRWVKPVRPHDRLSGRLEILDTRASKSRPKVGLVAMSCTVENQSGDVVLTQKHTQIIRRREAANASFAPPSQSTRADAARPAEAETPQHPPLPGWFEDLQVGAKTALGAETFTRDAIIDFARKYDPQPFHLDEEAARRSLFGRLAASGWHTASAWMKHLVEGRKKYTDTSEQESGPAPQPGPSPGFTNLRWHRPVYAGDTISFATELADKRVTSRPGWGLIFSRNTGINQDGVLVYEFTGSAFWPLRPK